MSKNTDFRLRLQKTQNRSLFVGAKSLTLSFAEALIYICNIRSLEKTEELYVVKYKLQRQVTFQSPKKNLFYVITQTLFNTQILFFQSIKLYLRQHLSEQSLANIFHQAYNSI